MFRESTSSNYNATQCRFPGAKHPGAGLQGNKLPGAGAGECIVSGTGTYRARGLTIWELIVLVVLVALVIVLAMAALARWRQAPRSTDCLDNLRQLAAAAHQYADDFNERFFYHWPIYHKTTGGDVSQGREVGWWYDSERAGQYLTNTDRRKKKLPPDPTQHYGRLDELIRGPMVCPTYYEEGRDILRSYAMNFWASGVEDGSYVGNPFRTTQGNVERMGDLFRRTSDQLDQLMLFTEAVILEPPQGGELSAQEDYFGWASAPSERWAGITDRSGYLVKFPETRGRGRAGSGPMVSWIVEYSRHGVGADPSRPTGAVNIALADGHVQTFNSGELHQGSRSTYRVLWSLRDKEIDDKWLEGKQSGFLPVQPRDTSVFPPS